MPARHLTLSLLLASVLASGATVNATDPGPDKPLQTLPEKPDEAFVLLGWTANITGVGGDGKTSLVINGEAGYKSTATFDGSSVTAEHPASFVLADKDHRITLKVVDARGAEWTETIDVAKGMRVTVDIKARYEHRGWEGTVKNDTMGCNKAQRRFLKFEIYSQGNLVGNAILLEPGKSAHGVRLKPGTYDLKIFERVGADYRLLRTTTLDPKQAQWRYDEGCQ